MNEIVKTETLSFRVSVEQKNDFEIECQRQQIEKSVFLYELFNDRHFLNYIKSVEGMMIQGISKENEGFLNAYAALKSTSVDEVLVKLVQDFVNSQSSGNSQTQVSLSENSVNGGQLSGLQTFANVNNPVNSGVYNRLQSNSEKTTLFVNRQKALENIHFAVIKESLCQQLYLNALEVISYAKQNSGGIMSKSLDDNLLYQILLKNFSEEQIAIIQTM